MGDIKAPPNVTVALHAALDRILDADSDGNGMITGGRWKPEMGKVEDPLSQALYDYVDYANYSGRGSLYRESRGDVMTGGLGMGYTLRPTHYTTHRHVRERDLHEGVTELRRALTGAAKNRDDAPAQHLDGVHAILAAGVVGQTEAGATYGAIHQSVEKLLDHIVEQTEQKEREVRDSAALLTHAELQNSLAPGSTERLLVDTLLAGVGEGQGEEPWALFFPEVARLPASARQEGHVGDLMTHYLLVVGKRARQAELLERVRAALPDAPAPAKAPE